MNATDRAQNPAFRSVSYRVVFPFNGFASRIANGGWTSVKAGDALPFKFSLGGNYGLGVLTGATAQPVDCTSGAPLAPATATAGSFAYNASLDRYMFVWPTDKGSAGSCRELTLTLSDGTSHRADLRLTK